MHPQRWREQNLMPALLRAAQLREGRWCAGSWPSAVAVNARAQSGLGLVHILAALGYDWGLHLLLPLGADLELQVRPSPSSWLCLPMIDMALSTSLSAGRCLRNNTVVCSRLLSVHVSALGPVV